MGFIGVILSGLLLAIIATAFMVLLNSGIIHLVTLFLDFKQIFVQPQRTDEEQT